MKFGLPKMRSARTESLAAHLKGNTAITKSNLQRKFFFFVSSFNWSVRMLSLSFIKGFIHQKKKVKNTFFLESTPQNCKITARL
jgi:hypothetical protein